MEGVLAIPFLGGLIVMGTGYTVLGLMFILHVVTLVVGYRAKDSYGGSVLGIITSALAWIPFLGWILHVLTAVFLLISAARNRRSSMTIYRG
ncbi:hypothetical protein SAMN03159358_4214 [Paenibacillus sp. NFR01]|nr:hypothetical protein SAMN03159358_4214 [Paenibacillus sp. NFR01]